MQQAVNGCALDGTVGGGGGGCEEGQLINGAATGHFPYLVRFLLLPLARSLSLSLCVFLFPSRRVFSTIFDPRDLPRLSRFGDWFRVKVGEVRKIDQR